jgi:hypothetical protein
LQWRVRSRLLPVEDLLPCGPPTSMEQLKLRRREEPFLKLSGAIVVERMPLLDVLMVVQRAPWKDLHGKQSRCVAGSSVGGLAMEEE